MLDYITCLLFSTIKNVIMCIIRYGIYFIIMPESQGLNISGLGISRRGGEYEKF